MMAEQHYITLYASPFNKLLSVSGSSSHLPVVALFWRCGVIRDHMPYAVATAVSLFLLIE